MPPVGVWRNGGQTILIFTTRHEEWGGVDATWYGTFRSRQRTVEAFEAWIEVLGHLGHREPKANLSTLPRVRASRVVGFRRLDALRADEIDGDSLTSTVSALALRNANFTILMRNVRISIVRTAHDFIQIFLLGGA